MVGRFADPVVQEADGKTGASELARQILHGRKQRKGRLLHPDQGDDGEVLDDEKTAAVQVRAHVIDGHADDVFLGVLERHDPAAVAEVGRADEGACIVRPLLRRDVLVQRRHQREGLWDAFRR